MNIGQIIKATVAGINYISSRRTEIEGFVKDAEALFPDKGQGQNKLSHVMGNILATVDTASFVATTGDFSLVIPILAGFVSKLATKLFPKG